MSIGSIVVDLLARTGSFETDMDRAAKTAKKKAKEIDDSLTKMAERVGVALGSIFSAKLAVDWFKGMVDGLDALNDTADATGASIEKISALEDVAGRTGATMDTVTGIMVKFNAALKEADGKNEVSQVLKGIGLDAAELKRMDPADALLKTAQALDKFADDGSKARDIQILFGKSIKEAAPFLKDLAEKTELVGKVTGEQAQQAENFNKALFNLEKNSKDAGRALLNNLLPAMNEVMKALKNGGFTAAINEFGEQAFNWTSNANTKRMNALRKDIADLQEEAGSISWDVFGQKGKIEKDIADKTATLRSLEKQFVNGGTKYGDLYVPPAPDKPSAPEPKKTGGGSSASGDKKTKAESYLDTLSKQLNKAKELTAYETALDEIQSGRLGKVTAMEKDLILTRARQIDDTKALSKYDDLAAEATKQREADLIKLAEQQEQSAQSLVEGNTELKNQIGLIGKNAEEQAKLEQARITETIAQKEQLLAAREIEGAYQRELDAIRLTITTLKERRDLIGQKGVAEKLADDAKKADEFAQQLGASFESAFEKAIVEGGKLSDVLSGLAQDVAKLWLRQNVTGPLAKMLSGSGGSGGGSGSGAPSWLSGLGSSIGGALSGFGGWIGGLLSGKAFADGGVPPIGKASLVGERGPELFVPNTAGRIIPNHALGGGGGPTVIQQFTVGDVATRSQVRNSVQNSQRQSAAALARSSRYGGVFG